MFADEPIAISQTLSVVLVGCDEDARAQLLRAIGEIAATQREIKAALSLLPESPAPVSQPAFLERITVKADGRVVFIRADDVDYMEAAANYVRICVGAQVHLLRQPLGNIAARLDPSRFARIHRSTIVNVDRIKEIQPWFSGDAIVILRDGRKLRLSRHYRAGFDLGTRSRL